jgi:hypothetical protein
MYLDVNQQDLIFGLTITPGEGVEDITAQFIESGAQMPTPGLGPAAPSDKPMLDTGTVSEETVEPLIGDAGGTFKVGSAVWYKSPWLWGGAALLLAAAATAVVWSRRTAR